MRKKGYDFEILENGLVSGNASQYGSWNVKHAANHFTSSKVREEQERIYESIPEDVRASCREEHREELDMLYFDEADEKKYSPSVVSVAKRTSVRRLTLNGRKPLRLVGLPASGRVDASHRGR